MINSSLLRLIPVLALLLFAPAGQCDDGELAAEAMAERMLSAIGGREAWAAVRNTINGSQQDRAGEPTVVHAVITIDFEQPRFRIETTAKDLHLVRVINGEKSWRLRRSGSIEDVPPDLLNDDEKWYAAHLYRTIHRIAARDPEISLKVDEEQRLEVYVGGARLLWFQLDAKGEPYAFGSWEDEVGSLTGPWDFVKDGIHHPRWVSSTDGTWRAAVESLTINVPLSEQMFARPANIRYWLSPAGGLDLGRMTASDPKQPLRLGYGNKNEGGNYALLTASRRFGGNHGVIPANSAFGPAESGLVRGNVGEVRKRALVHFITNR